MKHRTSGKELIKMKKFALVDPSILEELQRFREEKKVSNAPKSKQHDNKSDINHENISHKVTNEDTTTTGRDLSLLFNTKTNTNEGSDNYKQPNNYDLSPTEKRLIVLEKHLASLLNGKEKTNQKSKVHLASSKSVKGKKKHSKTAIIQDYNESLAEMMKLRKRRKSGKYMIKRNNQPNSLQVS